MSMRGGAQGRAGKRDSLTAVRRLPRLVRRRTLPGAPLIKFITSAYAKRATNPGIPGASLEGSERG